MFLSFVLGVLVSMTLFYHRLELPSVTSMAVSAAVTLAMFAFKRYWWPYKTGHFYVGLIIGFQWAFWHSFFQPKLPDPVQTEMSQLQGSTRLWEVTGEVVSLPRIQPLSVHRQKVQFNLSLQQLKAVNCTPRLQPCHWQFRWGRRPVIRLSDYQAKKIPHAGETWQFVIHLKPIHGLMNPGGYDLEAARFQQGIVAKGWVKHGKQRHWVAAKKLSDASPFSVLAWREQLRAHWQQQFADSPNVGVYLALLLGDRANLTQDQWQLFQQTGTSHLMAISGLHIGIAAGMGAFFAALLWQWGIRFFPHRPWYALHATPKVQWMAVGALIFATFYAFLAGMSIPTQRAWLMVMAMLLFVWLRRPFQPWSALALAALLVLFWHPSSVLSAGFWLSFTAVALIFACLYHPRIQPLKNWQKLIVIQVVLTVGLVPLLAYYFHQFPLVSLMANLIAVPAVSFLGLPLLMISVLLPVTFLQSLNEAFWQLMMQFLSLLAQWQPPLTIGALSGWQVSAIYGLLFYGLWKKVNLQQWLMIGFSLALIWLLPKWWQPSVQPGDFKATLLDVGQGQSLVVQTARHVAVLDTGPRWNAQYNGASLAILPYFRSEGIKQVDRLVVSHSDMDHTGGTQQLLERVPVQKRLSGQPQKVAQMAHLDPHQFQHCQAGQQWQWEGVKFQILAPSHPWPFKDDNDQSCVVRIENERFSLLDMGDASVKVEQYLLNQVPKSLLKADILIAGHHGSRTASSLAFLQAVQPKWVLFSSGFQNRYHFPSQVVRDRLAQLGIPWLNTAEAGAITIRATLKSLQLEGYRAQNAAWYHFKHVGNHS